MSQPSQDDSLYGPLIDQIKAGKNREANYEKLYKILYPKILKFFIRRGFTEEESPDLTQEVLFRVFKNIDTYRGESPFGGWVFSIAERFRGNELRHRHAGKRDTTKSIALDEALEHVLFDNDSQPGQGSALDRILNQEQLLRLRAAYKTLPPQMQKCVFFRHVRGYKYEEISTLLKVSVGTVKAHLAQAKAKLKQALGANESSGASK